jgi:Fur family ferric uptake transcriptional regulator
LLRTQLANGSFCVSLQQNISIFTTARYMNSEETILRLQHKGIKPTANRILVYRTLCQKASPLSLTNLEAMMPTMDKSSIFRVLSLFLQHDVVHAFEDGRGIINYELCNEQGTCDHHDSHLHFYCEHCQRSFCLDSVQLPDFNLPDGFCAHNFSFVIKGLCPQCAKRQHKG